MLIDPRHRRRRKSEDSPPVTAEVLASVVLELAPLEQLGHWVQVQMQLSELADALAGTGSMTRAELDRLRRWSQTWRKLDTGLRSFYAEHVADHVTASVALYRILDGGEQLEGWQYGRLKGLYVDHFGREPSVLLAPIASRSR